MESLKTIPRSLPLDTCSDYDELLQRGTDCCQKLASDSWTDYNHHDPGVTILQQLCFALTDLSYRTDFDVADLLATPAPAKPPEQPLYTGDRILTCAPLTTDDYRKLLYDRIKGLKNAWLVPVEDHPLGVQGLFDVLIETFEDVSKSGSLEILRKVRQNLRRTRNLAEDVDQVRLLQPQFIRVKAAIEIQPQADPSNLLAEVLFKIQCSLVPFPSVQVVDDLFDRETPDRIWNGPRLDHGALEQKSLKERRNSIERQGIANIILQVDGVKRVKQLTAGTVDDQGNFANIEELDRGSIAIQEGCVPRLAPQTANSINVELEGGFKTRVDPRTVSIRIQQKETDLRAADSYAARSLKASSYTTLPKGTFRDIAQYFSIQQQFPATYGLSRYGAAHNLIEGFGVQGTPDRRTARLRQLRAYLLFFEQPMADYLAQLAHVGELFSLDEKLDHSYFHQSLVNDSPFPGHSQNVSDVLRQPPTTISPASVHYMVGIVDANGQTIFASGPIPSRTAARELRLQIVESAQHRQNYRSKSITSTSVQVSLHNAAGKVLATSQKPFDTADAANAAAESWSRFIASARSKPSEESPVKIFRRQNPGLQIVNDELEVVLVGTRMHTQPERELRIKEILAAGGDRRNYRIHPTPSGFRIELNSARGETLAEGEIISTDAADAEEGVDKIMSLLRLMGRHKSVRERHLRRLDGSGDAGNNPSQAYQQGLERLWRHEDRDFLRRRNKILNHLLARFGEQFDDDILERLDLRPFGEKDGFFRELIRWKIEFLRGYVAPEHADEDDDRYEHLALGSGRALGIDCLMPEGSIALSGLERRVSLLLGLHGHDKHAEYSVRTSVKDEPEFSCLEKYVTQPDERKDESGSEFPVSHFRIAGPWFEGEPDLHDLRHNFVFSSEDSSVLRRLLVAGRNPESYRIHEAGGEYRILYLPPESGQAIEIHRAGSRSEADDSLSAMLRYLETLNATTVQSYAGERMYVLEHILLRPHGESGKTSFHISSPDSGRSLRSTPVHKSQTNQRLNLALHYGKDETKYRVDAHSSGKYVVVLVHEEILIATGSQLFETEQEAAAAIVTYVELVCAVSSDPRERKKHVHAPQPDEFYSHRVSVMFPNWPARFQNNEFKLYAEQLIYENAPAHVSVQCFWLAAHEMADFENLYGKWKSLKREVQLHEESPKAQTAANHPPALNETAAKLQSMIEALQEKQKKSEPPQYGRQEGRQ